MVVRRTGNTSAVEGPIIGRVSGVVCIDMYLMRCL